MATDWLSQLDKTEGQKPQQQNPQASNQGMLSGPLQQSGLSNIPFLGGILNSLAKGGEEVAEGGKAGLQLANVAADQPGPVGGAVSGAMASIPGGLSRFLVGKPTQADNNPSFMNQKDFQNVTQNGPVNAVAQGAGQGLQTGLAATSILGAPGLIKGIASLPGKVASLSPSVSGKAVGAAVEGATKSGAGDGAPDVITEFKQAVEDRLGGPGGMDGDLALQKSYGKMLQILTGRGDATPDTLAKIDPKEFTGQFSPADLVQGRQNLVTRFGYSPTDEGTLDQKVANIARDVLSRRAKDITPGLSEADRNFMRSKNFQDALHQVAPQLLKMLSVGAGVGAIGQVVNSLRTSGGANQSGQ